MSITWGHKGTLHFWQWLYALSETVKMNKHGPNIAKTGDITKCKEQQVTLIPTSYSMLQSLSLQEFQDRISHKI